MPEYACEPGEFDTLSVYPYTPPVGKYVNDEIQYVSNNYYVQTGSISGQRQRTRICGFLAETPPTEDRPISFYLSVVSLVYCVVLTIVFAVWACRQPRLPAVSRRAVPARLPPHAVPARLPPQVVIQGSAL